MREATAAGGDGTGRHPVPGRVVRVVDVPPRGAALEVARGQALRLVDLDGRRAGDLVCFNRDDLTERYSPQNTILHNRTIYPQVGAALVSDRGRPMLRLLADTAGGHDLIGGSCSEEYYRNRLEYQGVHRPCRVSLAAAMVPWGMELHEIPFAFIAFLRRPPPEAAPSGPGPGDYVDFLAEMDLVVAQAACPPGAAREDGVGPGPLRLVLWEPPG